MNPRSSTLLTAALCIAVFSAGAVLAGTVTIPRSGQTITYAFGDDGDLQAGVAWPVPRFSDNGDGTLTDELTGLMWLKDGTCLPGGSFWNDALIWIDQLNTTGVFFCADYTMGTYSDWRLPNVNELESLVNAGEPDNSLWLSSQGFVGFDRSRYWSSTSLSFDPGFKWNIDMRFGYLQALTGVADVAAVRAGQTDGNPDAAYPANIWKTGQTISYAGGDDGDLEVGVSWPTPRLVDNGDGTATDNLTGLTWLSDVNCLGMPDWNGALAAANTLASGTCDLFDGSAPGDWRLPNRKELHSRTDFSQSPSTCSTFGVPVGYWASTTFAADATFFADFVRFSGCIEANGKSDPGLFLVWPVRGAGIVNPRPDVKANGSDVQITITQSDFLTVTAEMTAGDLIGSNADWWLLVDTAFGWYHYDGPSGRWRPGETASFQGPLMDIGPYTLVSASGLAPGTYVLYVEVDMTMNGIREPGFSDSVQVDVIP